MDNEIEGNFKMMFVGRPNGKLMKGAPGNYEHGKVYIVPYRWSQWKYWELLEDKPELEIPDVKAEEEMFIGVTYVPDEAGDEDEHAIPLAKNEFLLPSADSNIIPDEETLKKLEEQESEPRLTRDELKATLDGANIKYNPRLRTETLRAMVKKLDEDT